MNVSIVMPLYQPDHELLRKIQEALSKQKFDGKTELILEEKWGLAQNMNAGIKKARHDLIVTLHQDCIPEGEDWLKKLAEPFQDQEVVASVSKVELPEDLWRKFGIFTRALTLSEKGVVSPLLDEKGCAYRKRILEEVGGFDAEHFRTAGEDFDAYLKLMRRGRIAYPDCRIIHFHSTGFFHRIRKVAQNANGYGALVRIHGREMVRWWMGFLKAFPLFGIFFFLIGYPFRRGIGLFPFYLLLTPLLHGVYFWNFWKGFFEGRQSV